MPIIESFSVDHTKMKAPAVRLSKIMTTPKGDSIKIFDLRFCQPNRAMMPEKGLHTAWKASMYSINAVKDLKEVPGINKYQCGSYQFHSLAEAHAIATAVLSVGIGVNFNEDLKIDDTLIKNQN